MRINVIELYQPIYPSRLTHLSFSTFSVCILPFCTKSALTLHDMAVEALPAACKQKFSDCGMHGIARHRVVSQQGEVVLSGPGPCYWPCYCEPLDTLCSPTGRRCIGIMKMTAVENPQQTPLHH